MPISEEEFRQRTVSKYREHFNHVYVLLEFAQEAIGNYKAFTQTAYHASLNLIFPKAYKSFDATRRLCEIASCEDAAVILRSLLNLLATTRWISLAPDKRAKKYLAWYWVAMHSDAEHFKDRVPPEWIPTIQNHYDRVKKQFEYQDDKGKTQFPRQWYQPEVQSIRDMFVEANLEKQYDEGYKPLSGIEHSDATAYLPMLMSMESTEGHRRLEIQSDINVPHYLRNDFQYFGEIFRICNQTNPLADGSKLNQIIANGKKFYEVDMQSKGLSPY
jgi:hypothetical protein